MAGIKVVQVVLASFASYLEFALYLLCGVIVARSLGPNDYGIYAFSVWLTGLMIVFATNGLNTSSIQQIALALGRQQHDIAQGLVRQFKKWQTISVLLVSAVTLALLFAFPLKEWKVNFLAFVLVAMLSTWARSLLLLNVSIAKAFEDFRMGNLCGILGATISLGFVVFWHFSGGGILGFFLIYAISGLIASVTSHVLLRKHLKAVTDDSFTVSSNVVKQTITTAIYFLLSALVARTFETALLKQFHSPTLVGFFVISGVLSKGIVEILVSGYEKVLLPSLARTIGHESKTSLQSSFSSSVRVYWVFGLLASGIGIVAADLLVVLLYGPSFVGAAKATAACMVISGLTIFVGAINALLLSTEHQMDRVKGCLVAIVTNCTVAFLLIPTYGINGAVAALGAGLFSNTAVSVWQVHKRFNLRLPYGSMVRFFFAHLVSAAFVHAVMDSLTGAAGLFLKVITFGILFLMLSVLLFCWNSSEFDILKRLLLKKFSANGLLVRFLNQIQSKFGRPN